MNEAEKILSNRIAELEAEVKKLNLRLSNVSGCSHLWTKSSTSANTDWWCSCGSTTNKLTINENFR